MARKRMTEEEKAAKKVLKEQAFDVVAKGLKYLTYPELEEVIGLCNRMKKDKLSKEELRLIKEKEKIELQIQKLKEVDSVKNF